MELFYIFNATFPTAFENSIFCEHMLQIWVMIQTCLDANRPLPDILFFVSREFFLYNGNFSF